MKLMYRQKRYDVKNIQMHSQEFMADNEGEILIYGKHEPDRHVAIHLNHYDIYRIIETITLLSLFYIFKVWFKLFRIYLRNYLRLTWKHKGDITKKAVSYIWGASVRIIQKKYRCRKDNIPEVANQEANFDYQTQNRLEKAYKI